MRILNRLLVVACAGCVAGPALAQIDPYSRELIELGYHKEINGLAPIAGYAYYYRNIPEFVRSNLTLRLVIAPTYVEGELGIRDALGPHTDVGLGFSGGGFYERYDEIRRGNWFQDQSWMGHGGSLSASIYHLFNPDARVPLSAILRGSFQYAFYERNEETAASFVIPRDQPEAAVRAGLRYGGEDVTLMPDLGMELSAWYEGRLRLQPGSFGYANDRAVESSVHLFWARAALRYTMPECKHTLGLSVNAGTSIHPDRLSAYRLGGMLDLASEFPYTLPGYYFNELSTRNFILVAGSYEVPLDARNRWRVGAGGATGLMSFTPGMDQPDHWNSGVTGGLSYRGHEDSFRVSLVYGYGINAIRGHSEGGHAVALLMQIDLAKPKPGNNAAPGADQQNFFKRLIRAF